MTKNIVDSVHARLSNQAKETKRPFQELLQYYGLERFLYRFSKTRHVRQFLLKGALMLRVWGASGTRSTRDIDLLGLTKNEINVMEAVTRDACNITVDDDGLHFDSSTVAGERIMENAGYEGVRIKFVGYLGKARIPIQIDVGFGDVVYPGAEEQDYPTLLDLPAPRLRMYPRETVVAEKFEAMVYLGVLNSRFKDFFDIWLLCQRFDFDGVDLAVAIKKTFEHRRTELSVIPVALTPVFVMAENTQKQWAAFVKRSKLHDAPVTFDDVQEPLRQFLLPITSALINSDAFLGHWSAPGPWVGISHKQQS